MTKNGRDQNPAARKAPESSFDIEAFVATYGGAISKLKPGAPIYSQGESADSLIYIQEGQVQITVVSRHGKEGILGVLGPGDICGEGSLLANRNRVATARCLTASKVVRLERADVLRGLRNDPAAAEFLVFFALSTIVRLRENLVSQLFDSSEKRLARILLILAHYGDEGHQDKLIRHVDQEALAQMIGTTRSRVNYFMNKFRKLGCIDYDGSAIAVRGALSAFVLEDRSFDGIERRRSPHDNFIPGAAGQAVMQRWRLT